MKEKDESWPLVSVVIVAYNSENVLERCFRSMLNSDYPKSSLEVIFVDNASTDESFELVMKNFGKESNVRIFQNSRNLGYAGGYSVGMKHCRGKYVVTLDPDTEVDSRWLTELIKVMEADPTIGAAQSKLLLMDYKDRFDSAGGSIDYLGIESSWSASAYGEEDIGQYDKNREIFYAMGAAMTIKRKVLEEAGLYDFDFFINYEDIDLCWRIRLLGYKIIFVPKSVVYHVGGRLQSRIKWPPGFFHLRKNHILTLIKNYNFGNLIKYMPSYVFLLLLHSLYMALKKEIRVSFACLRAILWNIHNFRLGYLKRRYVQIKLRKLSDEQIKRCMTKPIFPRYLVKPKHTTEREIYYTSVDQ